MKPFQKTVIGALGAFSLLPLAEAQSDSPNYTNYIRMVEYGGTLNPEGAILKDIVGIEASGTDEVFPDVYVPKGGASFFLWTIREQFANSSFSFPQEEFLLDAVTVTSFLPTAEIKIQTHDRFSAVPRTRADKPFQLIADVKGLVDAASLVENQDFELSEMGDVPVYAQQLLVQRFVESYPEGENSLPNGEFSSSPLANDLVFAANGLHPESHAFWTPEGDAGFSSLTAENDYLFYSQLSGDGGNVNKARGEEQFVIYADIPDSNLFVGKASVQVWPVWSGGKTAGLDGAEFISYEGLDAVEDPEFLTMEMIDPEADYKPLPNEPTYEFPPSGIVFQLQDLFPNCEVAVVVNDAEKPFPWGGRVLENTRRVFNENGSHDHTITIEEWPAVFDGNGRYGVWLVVNTPGIGWEVAGTVDSNGQKVPGGWALALGGPKITVRGSIHSFHESQSSN